MQMILISTVLVLLAAALMTGSSALGGSTPPIVTTDGPYVVDEGSIVTMTAIGTDPAIAGYYWDVRDDGSVDITGLSVPFGAYQNFDGPANVPVRLSVKDLHGVVIGRTPRQSR